MGVQLL